MPSNDKPHKRRIGGIAALSVTALGSLLGAPSASADTVPPGQTLAELRAASPDTSASYFIRQGWPVKWDGERQIYQWWQKVEKEGPDA